MTNKANPIDSLKVNLEGKRELLEHAIEKIKKILDIQEWNLLANYPIRIKFDDKGPYAIGGHTSNKWLIFRKPNEVKLNISYS